MFLIYMTIYHCKCCNYISERKGNYLKHLITKKHKIKKENLVDPDESIDQKDNSLHVDDPSCNNQIYAIVEKNKVIDTTPLDSCSYDNLLIEEIYSDDSEHSSFDEGEIYDLDYNTLDGDSKSYKCRYCDKQFKYSQGLSKHVKTNCKKRQDEDMQELVRLLNEQKKLLDNQCGSQIQIQVAKETNEKMQKQISKLAQKLKIHNISNAPNSSNTFNTVNNTSNINLLGYENTNYSCISEREMVKCIKDCNFCVKTFIEKVHFNRKYPENMNIYISSFKADHIMIYRDGNWNIVDKKKHIDNMYEDNEIHLESWFDEYKTRYPEIINSFTRYLHNRETDEVLNQVKKDILRMLYNKRNLVIDNFKRYKQQKEKEKKKNEHRI